MRVIERRAATGLETSARAAGQIGQVRELAIARTAARYALEFAASLSRRRDPGVFVQSGSVTVVEHETVIAELEPRFCVASRLGTVVERLSARDAAALVPGLAGEVAAAYHVPSDGYVEPDRFVRALADDARARGVEVVTDVAVTGFDVWNGRVTAVRTSRGPLAVGVVVVAAGPWTASLVGGLDWRLPTVPIALRQARTEPAGLDRMHPVVRFPEVGAYLRPECGGYLFGAFQPAPELAPAVGLAASIRTDDLDCDPRAIESIRGTLARWLPAVQSAPVAQYRQGWTTFSPDGRPLAGLHPTIANLWVAAGCGAMGFVWAAALGRWLAQSIAEGRAVASLVPFDPGRFGPQGDDFDWVRGECRRRHAGYYGLAETRSRAVRVGTGAEQPQWT